MKHLLWAACLFACAVAAQPNPGAGSIEGHVFNSLTRTPIRKARVDLDANAAPIHLVAETDAAGRFRFTGLPPGTYKLSATQTGFLERAARLHVTLRQGDRVRDAEILLPPQGVITGRVLDEDGDPMGGARVGIFKQVYQDGRKQWDKVNAATLTNETGEYRLAGLRAGRYILQAESQRPMVNNHCGDRDRKLMYYVPAYHPNAATERTASPVEVGVGAEVREIDIQLFKLALPPSFRVSGRVTGAPSDSEIGVNLITRDDSRFGGNAVARPPEYTFEMNVRPGQYKIGTYMYSGGPAAYATGSLTVAGDVSGVVITLGPPPEVAARISVAEHGSRVNVQGVRVTLRRLPVYPGGTTEVRSGAAGKLAFPKTLAPGRYSLDVDRHTMPEGCYVQKAKLGGQEVSADEFEILTSIELEIVLSNTAGTIAGSVSDGDGKPFPGSAVTLIPTDGKSRPLKQPAADDGTFKIAGLPPGKYKLFAWEEVDDAVWQDPEFHKSYESRAREVTVGPSETQNVQLRLIAVEDMK